MPASRERSEPRGAVALAVAALLMVVCCAGPLLLAAGALGAVGGELANPWLITLGAVVILAGTAYALRCRMRRRRGAGPQDCCTTAPDVRCRDDDAPDRDVR